MLIHTLSASRLKTYLQCPEQYHQTYENGIRGTADHLVFGTLIHSTFERFYQEDANIFDIYEQEWTHADIADPQFYKDGYEIIDNFLTMNNKEGYATLGLEVPFVIDIQSHKIYDTSVVNWKNGEEVKAFLKTLEDEDAPIIFGFIDRVAYDMYRDVLKIHDYKTSRIPLTQYEADEDVQLSMYDLVASYLFPEYKHVVSELQYVRLGVPVRTSRSEEQREIFRKWLISMFYKIKEDKEHKAQINKYCGWCSAKSGCSAYQEVINGEADEELNLDGMSADELDGQLEKVNVYLKILEGRKKEIESFFKNVLKRNDNAGIQVNGGERYTTSTVRTAYDPMTVMKLFPHEASRLLSVNKTEVDKLAKGNSDLINELESTSAKSFTSPILRKRKSN